MRNVILIIVAYRQRYKMSVFCRISLRTTYMVAII